ncbi:uncharacterized protein LOC143363832 [Halictus rubicundus]|uniref:uncharacterized protein LOC143363832 n=1 Tax=Halictus rubicundus TaxID=77578 RepID=UPI00403757A5
MNPTPGKSTDNDTKGGDEADKKEKQSEKLDEETIYEMKVDQLKKELKARGLSLVGKKWELRTRLLVAMQDDTKKETEDEDETTEDDEESSEEEEDGEQRNRKRNRKRKESKFTIKDVEGSLCYFTGDDKRQVQKWISDFEDTSELLGWDSIQSFIYGKKMLQGSAKKFVTFEKGITSWEKLKRCLIREFHVRKINAEVHAQLYRRKKLPSETSRQYIYEMQEIAEQGDIEEDALIQHIVDGIPDSNESNKAILYSARSLRALKKNLEVEVYIRGGEITIRPVNIAVSGLKETCECDRTNDVVSDDVRNEVGKLMQINYVEESELDVSQKYRERINALVTNYQPARDTNTSVETKIVLRSEETIYHRPRRLAPREKAVLDKQIGEWLEKGIIYPSTSEFSSPVVIVPKKNGEYRVCIDYRKINRQMLRDRFPMPLIEDSIDSLAEARVFSLIDLKSGFLHVPSALSSEPVLRIYSPTAETELHTDASKEGYGAVLLQKDIGEKMLHPVHYMSRKTSDAEKNYHSYELELLAVIRAVQKFRVYLLGDIAPKVARWALTLEEFDYEVEHRSGSQLRHVDALSRYPVRVIEDRLMNTLRARQEEDDRIRAIKQVLQSEPYKDYVMENNLVMKQVGDKRVMVLPASMYNEVIRREHENGHFGVKKMDEKIIEEFYIPKLSEKLERLNLLVILTAPQGTPEDNNESKDV